MANYLAPGLYSSEFDAPRKSIRSGAGDTGIMPIFMGYTEINPGKAILIQSIAEFQKKFSDPTVSYTNGSYRQSFDFNVYVLSVGWINYYLDEKFKVYHAIKSFFDNGGVACYVISVGEYDVEGQSPSESHFVNALNLIPPLGVLGLLAPVDGEALGTAKYRMYSALLGQCEIQGDLMCFLDVNMGEEDTFRTDIGMNNLKYGAAFISPLTADYAYEPDETYITGNISNITSQTWSEIMYLAPTIGGWYIVRPNQIRPYIHEAWLITHPPVPTSAVVLGGIQRKMVTTGTWNGSLELLGISEGHGKYSHAELAALNMPTDGSNKAINPVKNMGNGRFVLGGGRTLAGGDPESRYVSTRLLYLKIKVAIENWLESQVFESNDLRTWKHIETQVSSLLKSEYDKGTLRGNSPKEAYSIQIGLGTTMMQTDIVEGRLILEVSLAMNRPAEFFIIRFSHNL